MKKFLLLLSSLSLAAVSLNAAVPSFSDFNTNQFGLTGNKVSVKSGASITNPIITGMFIGNNGLADAGVTNRPNITFDGDTWNFFQDGMPASFDGELGAVVFNGGGWQLSNIPGEAITNAVTNAVYATTAGSAATVAGILTNNTTGNAATATTATNLLGWVSVTDYGALGNGVSNDTVAFQRAITNATVYIPPGSYLLDSLWLSNNVTIKGCGDASRLLLKSGSTRIINSGTNRLELSDVAIDGQTAGTSDAGVNGIQIYATARPIIRRVTLGNFNGMGVQITGFVTNDASKVIGYNARVIENVITNCFTGVKIEGDNQAEYGQVQLNTIRDCVNGIWIESANNDIIGNALSGNANGILVCPTNGRSHCIIEANVIHHCNTYSLWASNCASGFLFQGNTVLGGANIYSTFGNINEQLKGNYFESGTVTCDDGKMTLENNTWINQPTISGYGADYGPTINVNNRYSGTDLIPKGVGFIGTGGAETGIGYRLEANGKVFHIYATDVTATNGFACGTNSSVRAGASGMCVSSNVGGTNYWVIDIGGGSWQTNHIP